jgi:hypothetical protein
MRFAAPAARARVRPYLANDLHVLKAVADDEASPRRAQ